jgi:hypothetical protein
LLSVPPPDRGCGFQRNTDAFTLVVRALGGNAPDAWTAALIGPDPKRLLSAASVYS